MKDAAHFLLVKASKLLLTAQSLIRDGYPNDAGRGAYLAAYHAAQAYIVDHTGRIAKTHSGTTRNLPSSPCSTRRLVRTCENSCRKPTNSNRSPTMM